MRQSISWMPYPADIRRQVKRNFIELCVGYRGLEKRVGFPKDHFAGALTLYLGSNYLAYTNLDLPRSELLQNPNPDISQALQDGAGLNLEALLGVAANRITITPSGLIVQ